MIQHRKQIVDTGINWLFEPFTSVALHRMQDLSNNPRIMGDQLSFVKKVLAEARLRSFA